MRACHPLRPRAVLGIPYMDYELKKSPHPPTCPFNRPHIYQETVFKYLLNEPKRVGIAVDDESEVGLHALTPMLFENFDTVR